MRRILITGGSGCLGAKFVEKYSDKFDISQITRKNTKNEKQNFVIDLSQNWSENSLPKEIDVLILLAQERNYKNFPENAKDIFMVNVFSIFKLLEYARINGIKKVIYASTGGLYDNTMESITEESKIRNTSNLSLYFSTKIAAESLIGSYRPFFDVVIIRPFFIYGENQNLNSLFYNLKNRLINNIPIDLQGEDGIKINPIYSGDAAAVLYNVVNSSHTGYINLAGNEIVTMRELATDMGSIIGKKPIFKIIEKNSDLIADISLVKKIMPNHQWTSLHTGLLMWLESSV